MHLYDSAIIDLNTAVKMEPDNSDYLNDLAKCYYASKKKKQAYLDWKKAIQLGNKEAQGYLESFYK